MNLIRSHACGLGEPFSKEVALVMMILRLNTLLKGRSGATLELVRQLQFFINERIIPIIPTTRLSRCIRRFSAIITFSISINW